VPGRRRDLLTLAGAASVVAAGACEARRDPLRHGETRVFAAVNGLSRRPYALVWTVMQSGSLAGALGIAAAVGRAGNPALGRRLAAVASLTWAASKVVKPLARRGRPEAVVDDARVLGRPQNGLGYPSGHAGVAVAMAAAAAPHLPAHWRWPVWGAAATAAGARVYVGAHLPLDAVGGAALGVATERAVRLLTGRG